MREDEGMSGRLMVASSGLLSARIHLTSRLRARFTCERWFTSPFRSLFMFLFIYLLLRGEHEDT